MLEVCINLKQFTIRVMINTISNAAYIKSLFKDVR